MTEHARVDVEWGGENVYVRTNTDAIQVQASLTDAEADTMRTQLGWAVSEVRRYRQHLADDGHAALFDGQAKPGSAPAEASIPADTECGGGYRCTTATHIDGCLSGDTDALRERYGDLWSAMDWTLWGHGLGDVLRMRMADTMIAALPSEDLDQAMELMRFWKERRGYPVMHNEFAQAATLQEEANWWEKVRPSVVGRTQFGTWLRGRAEVHLRAAGVPVQNGEQ